jgi:chromosome segregation ATPase
MKRPAATATAALPGESGRDNRDLMERLDNSHVHRTLEEALRAVNPAARFVRFFAPRQAEWHAAVGSALTAIVRSLDEIAGRLCSAEERIGQLETELRTVREEGEDARRKLAALGVRLRDLEGALAASSRRSGPA